MWRIIAGAFDERSTDDDGFYRCAVYTYLERGREE